jgi:NADH-quinone oxidoreductase subunit C
MNLKYNLYLAKYLIDIIPKFIHNIKITNESHIILEINNINNFYYLFFFLKNNSILNYQLLMDMCCIHYLKSEYIIIYNCLNIISNHRIFVKIRIFHHYAKLPTISFYYKSAGWLEREVCDMFGIKFAGHIDLRRILTDYGFRGQPLRKTFPLIGFIEIRYDYAKKYLVYEPIEFSQTFRNFENFNPWG